MFDKEKEVLRFTLRINKDLLEIAKKQGFHNRRATGKEIEYVLYQYYLSKGLIKN